MLLEDIFTNDVIDYDGDNKDSENQPLKLTEIMQSSKETAN